MKQSLAVLSALILAGCASAPKPVMDVKEQLRGGQFIAGMTICATKGMMTTDLASRGKSFIEARLADWTFDPSNVDAGYRRAMEPQNQPTQEDCTKMAMEIHTMVRQVEANNAMVDQQRSVLQNIVNNRPKQTYCNRIGTQVLCNSF